MFSMTTKMSGYDPDPAGSVINYPPGFGSVMQDYGSADLDPKEIFTDTQHWNLLDGLYEKKILCLFLGVYRYRFFVYFHICSLILIRLERTGYVNAVSDFFSGLWNGKTDPCEEYYIATMVDPFFEVSREGTHTQIIPFRNVPFFKNVRFPKRPVSKMSGFQKVQNFWKPNILKTGHFENRTLKTGRFGRFECFVGVERDITYVLSLN